MASPADTPSQRVLLAAFAITTIALVAALWREASLGMHSWMYSYYFLSYEFEFVRRGLVGEVLRWAGVPISNAATSLMFSVAMLATWLGFLATYARIFSDQVGVDAVLFFGFIATCPALAQHFAILDFGRFDIFLVFSLLLSAVAAARLGHRAALFWIVILQILSCLIHEGALVLTCPMALAFWVARFHGKHGLLPACAGFAVVFGAAVLIWNLGSIEADGVEDLFRIYSERSGDGKPIFAGAIGVVAGGLDETFGTLYFDDLFENLREHAYFLAAHVPFFYVMFRMLVVVPVMKTSAKYVAVFALVSPLLLYPLGHDFFRWWSFAMTGAVGFLVFNAYLCADTRTRMMQVAQRHRAIIVLGIALGIALGGSGDKESFRPERMPVLTWLSVL
jgi:hypothetical protein